MSQVFLSYASEDRVRAKRLADAMQRHGYQVWWDRQIVAGQEFDEVIEHALDESVCVVVLWSSASVKSQWVKTEAAEAASRRILVPARIDDVKIPLEFRRVQAADLTRWDGDSDSPEFQQFLRAVDQEIEEQRELALSEAPTALGGPIPAPAAPERPQTRRAVQEAEPPAPSRTQAGPRLAWILSSVAAVVLIGGAVAWLNRGTDPQTPDVVGMSYEQAVAAVAAASLSPERREQPSDTDAPGLIVAQSPSAGTELARGGIVSLTVAVRVPPVAVASTSDVNVAANPGPSTSSPPPAEPVATIPDLRGHTTERASALLAAADLRLGGTTEVAVNDVTIGTIVDQAPAASQTIARGAPVQITVATRRKTPELSGLNLQQAQDALTTLGLAQRIERVRAGARQPDNRVIGQAPAPGTEMSAGGEVTMTVAIVTPKRVDAGSELLRLTKGQRCRQVCKEIGLRWNDGWSGTTNTCTCDF